MIRSLARPAIVPLLGSSPHWDSGCARRRSLLLQQFLDPVCSRLPALVLVDGDAFERLDGGFGCVLGLQVSLQDLDVVIHPLQAIRIYSTRLSAKLPKTPFSGNCSVYSCSRCAMPKDRVL